MSVEIANNTTINAPTGGVFRFKFDRDINSILQRFASVHHGDDLEDFKDAWETFLKTFRTAIDIEAQRLKEIGYNGDVENKMLTSVRYYYCKQFKIGNTEKKDQETPNQETPVQEAPDEETDTQTKRKYVKINKNGYVFYISSSIIKEPGDDLVISSSLRSATSSLLKSYSIKNSKKNISTINIAPGPFKTKRVQELVKDIKKFEKTLPTGKIGDPKEIGLFIKFILQNKIKYISGSTIYFDGNISKSFF